MDCERFTLFNSGKLTFPATKAHTHVTCIVKTSVELGEMHLGGGRCTGDGRGSVFRESEFISEDPGFDPLAGQGEGHFFFLSLRVNSCADFFMPDPPSCV